MSTHSAGAGGAGPGGRTYAFGPLSDRTYSLQKDSCGDKTSSYRKAILKMEPVEGAGRSRCCRFLRSVEGRGHTAHSRVRVLAAGVTGSWLTGEQGSGRARPHFKTLNYDKASASRTDLNEKVRNKVCVGKRWVLRATACRTAEKPNIPEELSHSVKTTPLAAAEPGVPQLPSIGAPISRSWLLRREPSFRLGLV